MGVYQKRAPHVAAPLLFISLRQRCASTMVPFYFHESITPVGLLGICLIIIGIGNGFGASH